MAKILRHMLSWLGGRFVFLNKNGVLESRILKFGIRLPCLIIYGTYSLKLVLCGLLGPRLIGLKVEVFGRFLSLTHVLGAEKILKLRALAKDFIRFKVGDGSRVFIWLDHWHPAGYLLDKFGYRIVYDSGFHL
jgi:hypothetical protein